jgi:hypothetical protein
MRTKAHSRTDSETSQWEINVGYAHKVKVRIKHAADCTLLHCFLPFRQNM